MLHAITPNWKVPANVRAFSTLRTGGISKAPYDSLNLGLHVGDCSDDVQANRAGLPCPEQQLWLQQVHSCQVLEFGSQGVTENVADGSYTREKQQTCIVMTADCLPVLLTDKNASFAAALHCGWRGLADGIIEKCLQSVATCSEVIAWLGPAIGPDAFEVGLDVLDAFPNESSAFRQKSRDKYLADIFSIATIKLNQAGVNQVYSSNLCTYSDSQRFFSYRRDGQTGRMASIIWLE